MDGGNLLLKKLVEAFTCWTAMCKCLHHEVTVNTNLSLPGLRRRDPAIDAKKDGDMVVQALLRGHV
jgi:hypothetical protein